jgi:hypothetical protein
VRTVLLLEVMHAVGGIQEKENRVVIMDKTLHFKLPITTTEDLFRAIDYFYYNHTVTISVRYPTSTLHQGTSLLQPNAQVTHHTGFSLQAIGRFSFAELRGLGLAPATSRGYYTNGSVQVP